MFGSGVNAGARGRLNGRESSCALASTDSGQAEAILTPLDMVLSIDFPDEGK